jgi:hypothetical protein
MDIYHNKFWKEPYVHMHLYAQYFHPSSYNERIRQVAAYRRPKILFKGYRVPDWAQAHNRGGYDYDWNSRKAWTNALHALRSEWTPVQFIGQRQEPNALQWFRFEHYGKGYSSKYFYNEVPKPTLYRHKGHINNLDKEVFSFTHADQDRQFIFGLDTTTEEGRKAFEEEWKAVATMAPELLNKDEIVYPHEHGQMVSQEPHFQRVWQHYREHSLRLRFQYLLEQGTISEEDAKAFSEFVDLAGMPSINVYLLGTHYHSAEELADNEGFQATKRVFEALQLNELPIDTNSSELPEKQFWRKLDFVFELTEEGLREELPYFVTDPREQDKVNAILEGREQEALGQESTRVLA